MNRRSSTRVAVRLVCHVVWPHDERSVMLTENMSRDGMLLRWETAGGRIPAAGEMLIVEVELPEREGFEPRCIRCQATVARVHEETGATYHWVGLQIHAMDFRVAQAATVRDKVISNSHGSRAL